MNTLYMAMRVSTSGDGKKSTPAIKVAVAAVALSVAVMLAAIAIVLGFKEEITRKVTGFNPHILLQTNPSLSHDEYLIDYSPTLQEILDETPYITQHSLSASAPAIFKTSNDFKGIYLKSLSNDNMGKFIESQIIDGNFPDFKKNPDHLLISRTAADQLQVEVGDTLPTYFITQEVEVKPMKIAAIFDSHFSTYDDIYAFGSLPFIQQTGGIKGSQGTNVNIYVDDFDRLEDYAADLRTRLDNAYLTGQIYCYYNIETALTNGANFFSWLSLLDTNVVVIIVLMASVGLITLISGLMILILDKKRFIAIMRALGASNNMMRFIFVWLTLKVAVTGLVIGNALMLVILYLQERFHFMPMDADSYYIDFVPVKLNWTWILILNVSIIIITFLLLLIPARMVRSIKGNI